MKKIIALAALALALPWASAKLPALNDEAKAKAAEAAAKTAHGDKIASFQLCRAMDKVASRYQAEVKSGGKEAKAAVATPPCTDPGPYVAAVPASASSGTPSPATTAGAPAAPASAAAPKKG